MRGPRSALGHMPMPRSPFGSSSGAAYKHFALFILGRYPIKMALAIPTTRMNVIDPDLAFLLDDEGLVPHALSRT